MDRNKSTSFQFCFWLLYLESGFLSVADLTVDNLALLGISVHCQVSVTSQYLVRLLSQCWVTGGHTIHPPIKGLLPQMWYRTHTVPKFGLQSSWSSGACHYTHGSLNTLKYVSIDQNISSRNAQGCLFTFHTFLLMRSIRTQHLQYYILKFFKSICFSSPSDSEHL